MRMPWLKNTDGKPDAVLTFATFAIATVLFKMFFAGADLSWAPHFKWVVQTVDAASIGAILLPTLGAYVSNKYVNFNYHPEYVRMKKDINADGKEEDIIVEEEKKV